MSHDPLPGLLRSFCLTTMAAIYADTVQQAEQNQWGYRKFLQHLCESEAEDRRQRRVRVAEHGGTLAPLPEPDPCPTKPETRSVNHFPQKWSQN